MAGFSNTSSRGPSTPEFGAPPLLDDATLLAKARAAANGDRFTALFDNGEHDRGRYSNAVFRVCQYLAFWGNANESTIDRLFRQSALYREAAWVAPYKGGTYGASVIAAVVSRTEFTYQPSRFELHNQKLAKIKAAPGSVVDSDPEGFDTVTFVAQVDLRRRADLDKVDRDDNDIMSADDLLGW
jgi:hypothetical protein